MHTCLLLCSSCMGSHTGSPGADRLCRTARAGVTGRARGKGHSRPRLRIEGSTQSGGDCGVRFLPLSLSLSLTPNPNTNTNPTPTPRRGWCMEVRATVAEAGATASAAQTASGSAVAGRAAAASAAVRAAAAAKVPVRRRSCANGERVDREGTRTPNPYPYPYHYPAFPAPAHNPSHTMFADPSAAVRIKVAIDSVHRDLRTNLEEVAKVVSTAVLPGASRLGPSPSDVLSLHNVWLGL